MSPWDEPPNPTEPSPQPDLSRRKRRWWPPSKKARKRDHKARRGQLINKKTCVQIGEEVISSLTTLPVQREEGWWAPQEMGQRLDVQLSPSQTEEKDPNVLTIAEKDLPSTNVLCFERSSTKNPGWGDTAPSWGAQNHPFSNHNNKDIGQAMVVSASTGAKMQTKEEAILERMVERGQNLLQFKHFHD